MIEQEKVALMPLENRMKMLELEERVAVLLNDNED